MVVALRVDGLAARLDAALPQTQCTRCGYPDCAAYAQAIATGEAGIDQCPPGGAEGIARLASIMRQPPPLLNPVHGSEVPRTLASIDENWCIGCTLCIKACPTDAILGANKLMHTVIAAHCTGCELCVPVCPVDCIELLNASGTATGWAAWSQDQSEHARLRYTQRTQRLRRDSGHEATAAPVAADDRKAAIAAALARARAQRAA